MSVVSDQWPPWRACLISSSFMQRFSSTGWAFHRLIKMLSACVCLDVNQGATNRNRYTQRLVILHAQTYWWTMIVHQKLGQSDLLYGSKSPAEKKWAWIGFFKPAEPHSPCDVCWTTVYRRNWPTEFPYFTLLNFPHADVNYINSDILSQLNTGKWLGPFGGEITRQC